MGDPKIYRQYAEECQRMAMTMPDKHRRALLKIAEAWTTLADETEGKTSSQDGNRTDSVV
jgi:hypothetical protein